MSTQRRPLLSLALSVLVAVSAVGCSSPPPARLVAIEMIETLRGTKDDNGVDITDAEIECMLDVVEAMSEEEVETIALSGAQIVLDSFSSKLSACRGA